MKARIDIGLDHDGLHTFSFEPSSKRGAVDVPRATLERWAAEQRAFRRAYLRWKLVIEEVEELMYRTDEERSREPAVVAVASSARV